MNSKSIPYSLYISRTRPDSGLVISAPEAPRQITPLVTIQEVMLSLIINEY